MSTAVSYSPGYTSPEERKVARHRMRRAARIYAGTLTFADKIATYPDKGWAAMILTGVALVSYSLGCATLLVVEHITGVVFN